MSSGKKPGRSVSGVQSAIALEALVSAAFILISSKIGDLIGRKRAFMLGLVIRSSTGAIVAYFILTFLLPTVFGLLASSQQWFRDLQPWVDFGFSQTRLYDESPSGDQWGQLATSGVIWLVVPLVVGLVLTMRSEIK